MNIIFPHIVINISYTVNKTIRETCRAREILLLIINGDSCPRVIISIATCFCNVSDKNYQVTI